MDLARYILRRVVLAVFVLLGVLFFAFILAHSLGGNPVAAWLGRAASIHPEVAQAIRKEYHLNDPIWVQFWYYVINIAQGNWGYSPSRGFVPVVSVIAETLPYTLQLAFFAFIISVGLGVILGVLSARYHDTAVDGSIRTFYLAGVSSPPFFLALLLLIVFGLVFRLFPTGGAVDLSIASPTSITSIPVLDSLLESNFAYFASSLWHLVLPSVTLALITFGFLVRILRTSLLQVMESNFIRTARAKGLNERTVFFKHGLRNAMIPVVTLSSLIVTWLVTGTIFVEDIFAYPGIGQYVVQALLLQDYPGILGTTLVFALIIVTTNLAADLLYVVVDPQIRLG